MDQSTLDTLKVRLAAKKGRWPDVARLSGVPISTVRKIAQGHTPNPRIDTVDRLIHALDAADRVAA